MQKKVVVRMGVIRPFSEKNRPKSIIKKKNFMPNSINILVYT